MRIVAAGMLALFLTLSGMSRLVNAQTAKAGWQPDWEKTVDLAKKEGKVVVSIPASTELRAEIEKSFEKRYGIDVEPVVGRKAMRGRQITIGRRLGIGAENRPPCFRG